jgi:hypothetical protein
LAVRSLKRLKAIFVHYQARAKLSAIRHPGFF